MNQDGIWLSILDYASTKKTSISTIRRSIKAGHLKFKEENGKYFIWTKDNSQNKTNDYETLKEVQNLKKQNRVLQEELEDLKMLLTVYENQQNSALPPIPEISI